MTGGVAGLTATLFVGARIGKFKSGNTAQDVRTQDDNFRANHIPFIALGTTLLWFSWFGFNCGSVLNIVGEESTRIVGRAGINTAIAGASGGFTSFIIEYIINRNENSRYSLPALCNGILAGLVGITAGCSNVYPYAAYIIGLISAIVYILYSKLFTICSIDDPLEAAPIHFGAGSFGVIAVGWFDIDTGLLYGWGPKQFGIQCLAVAVILGWVAANTLFFFIILKLLGLHKVTKDEELTGLDPLYCGGYAMSFDDKSAIHYGRRFYEALERERRVQRIEVAEPNEPTYQHMQEENNAPNNNRNQMVQYESNNPSNENPQNQNKNGHVEMANKNEDENKSPSSKQRKTKEDNENELLNQINDVSLKDDTVVNEMNVADYGLTMKGPAK